MKIFLDTMIYLHYKSIEEIDFQNEFNSKEITIIIPRITIRELDIHKNTHKFSRIRERARKMLQRIEKWIEVKEIRPAVTVEYVATTPTIDYEKFNLNPDWNDDQLIAAILHYRSDNSMSDRIILVTQDTGPRLTARHFGIEVKQLPDKYKLPVEPDPQETEIRSLRQTIATLENALPRLELSFSNNEKPTNNKNFALSSQTVCDKKGFGKEIEKLKRKYPKINKDEANISVTKVGNLNLLGGPLNVVSDEEIKRYYADVDNYIEQYKGYLKSCWDITAAYERTIRFIIEVWNIGTAPAADVEVSIYFPDGFKLYEIGKQPIAPKEPSPPVQPRTDMQITLSRIASASYGLRLPDLSKHYNEKLETFSIRRTNSYNVGDHFQTIKHGDKVVLPEMVLIFDSYEAAKSFKCEYNIRPANLPEPKTGELHFIITKN